jgi:hypothetical protein
MKCLRCSADNPAGTKFCGQCGAPLDGTPAAVPADVLPPAVGLQPTNLGRPGPIARDRAPGEMKQVTVLFCDIVGSTL